MRRLALLPLIALAGWGLPPRPPASPCKPTPPIDLEARIVGDPAAPFGIEARAESKTGREVELEIVLPDGVLHSGGERRARGKRCELRVDARAPGRARREILVRATLHDGATKLTRVLSLVLNDAPPAPAGTPKTNSRGEAILEFGP